MGCGPCSQLALNLIGEPIYNPETVYAEGAYVVYAGVLYVSTAEGNTGNNPQEGEPWEATTILQQLLDAISPTEIDAVVQLFPEWDAEVAYSQNQIVRYQNEYEGWHLAISVPTGTGTNLGHAPDSGAEWWGTFAASGGYPLAEVIQALALYPSIFYFGDANTAIPTGTKVACYSGTDAATASRNLTLPSIDDYLDGQTITIIHFGLTPAYIATIFSVGAAGFRGTIFAGAIGFPILFYDETNLTPSSVTLMAMTVDSVRLWVVSASNSCRFTPP